MLTVLLGEGRKLVAFLSFDAFLVVVGGSLGAALIVVHSRDLRVVYRALPSLLGWGDDRRAGVALNFRKLLATYRRQGPLQMEQHLDQLESSIFRAAVQQFVDGTDIDVIVQILETEKERVNRRGQLVTVFFENLGSFAPTFGIVGTVISLVSVLSHLDEPQLLAQGVAEAFIATFYGVLFANLIFLPMSMRATRLTERRLEDVDMIITGMRSIAMEEHPLLLSERMRVYLPREADESSG